MNLNKKDFYVDGKFSAERFWNAAAHEGGHYNMTMSAFANENSMGRFKDCHIQVDNATNLIIFS